MKDNWSYKPKRKSLKESILEQSSIIGRGSKVFLLVSLTAILISSLLGSLLSSGDHNATMITISTLSSLFGVVTVFLLANKNYNGYIFGVVQVILLGVVNIYWSLWGQAFLSLIIYLSANISGFYLWKQYKQEEYVTRKQTLTNKLFFELISIVVLLGIGFSFILHYTNSNDPYPFLDGFITMFALLGTYLMVNRYDNQWVIWMVVNIITIALYSSYYHDTHSVEYIPQIIMWIFTLINSVYGYIIWKQPIIVKIFGKQRNIHTNKNYGRYSSRAYGSVSFNGYKNTNYRHIKVNNNSKKNKRYLSFKVRFGSRKNISLKILNWKYKGIPYKQPTINNNRNKW